MMTHPAIALLLALQAQQATDSNVARAAAALRPLVDSVSLAKSGYMPLAFGPVRDLTPFQGQHWLDLLRIAANAPVDLTRPTFVMYLPVHDSLIPIGVAYTRRIAQSSPVPTTIGGVNAEWHTHVFCRNVPGEGVVLADGTEDCKDRGGVPMPNQIAMVHTWTVPNPDGPYGHDNPSLPYIATGLTPPEHPTRDDRLLGVALGETYGAKLPEAHRIDWEARRTKRDSVLEKPRAAIRELVPQMVDAQRKGNAARFELLRKKAVESWTSLLAAYHGLAPTPEIGKRLDMELEMAVGGMEMRHGG